MLAFKILQCYGCIFLKTLSICLGETAGQPEAGKVRAVPQEYRIPYVLLIAMILLQESKEKSDKRDSNQVETFYYPDVGKISSGQALWHHPFFLTDITAFHSVSHANPIFSTTGEHRCPSFSLSLNILSIQLLE